MSHLTVILCPAKPKLPPPESHFTVMDIGNTVELAYHRNGEQNWAIRISSDHAYELGTALITVARP